MQKLLIALSIAMPAISGHAEPTEQLPSFTDVISAINRGATVSVIVDLTKCATAGDTTMQGSTRGGLKINTYQILADGTLYFADERATVSTFGDPRFPSNFWNPTWLSVRYNLKPNQTVSVATEIFSIPHYSRLAGNSEFTCAINQGVEFYTKRY
ncbi:conserved exported protein of unknown function (plasmid) [Cupriavidus taiwanensis]|uniref:VirK protein n=1 Tax=Cupriavidus taiwanensis TaxID=164546 RepID=A0A375ECJ0_9BURK|nr:VirK family protein [Cupriavidus taiwanensis]SOZ71285.1 conserved exported protein of unknown function [Cupriavidus taiwanensis]SOZ72339.1 conserved exported protein of unknown function [Cupriavidus taiwanensis]SOZ74638.1 conserved exported protein of unknown function [Cupriavidus taiwanensis]SPA03545.1 conserved exported protein of unknown function [Cupriavidus taiwanensis]SPA11444.1 conserved exported protein of unknown function [Cupriavidus taiwanensis]